MLIVDNSVIRCVATHEMPMRVISRDGVKLRKVVFNIHVKSHDTLFSRITFFLFIPL